MRAMRGSRTAGALALLGAMGLAILLVGGIFLTRAEIAWREALSRKAAGDAVGAVRAARTVFDLYVPWNPRLAEASRLIADEAESRAAGGDRAKALSFYRTLRSAWIAAHPVAGDGGWVARCEGRIADLSGGGSRALGEMRAPRRPRGPWSALAALAFGAWVLATLGLLSRGFGPDGRLRSARGVLGWIAVIAAGYAAWIAGLMRA
jgi:hypothetical protein